MGVALSNTLFEKHLWVLKVHNVGQNGVALINQLKKRGRAKSVQAYSFSFPDRGARAKTRKSKLLKISSRPSAKIQRDNFTQHARHNVLR